MQKRSRDYNGNLPENEKVKKAIILTIKIKICNMFIEKKEKNIWKNIIIKEKNW